jgi:hypothetical protein
MIELSDGLQMEAREQRSDVFSCVLSLGCGRRRRAKQFGPLSANHIEDAPPGVHELRTASDTREETSTTPKQRFRSVSIYQRRQLAYRTHPSLINLDYPHSEVRYGGIKTHGSPYTARNLGLAPRRLVEQGTSTPPK